jgi:hypothetical protein
MKVFQAEEFAIHVPTTMVKYAVIIAMSAEMQAYT